MATISRVLGCIVWLLGTESDEGEVVDCGASGAIGSRLTGSPIAYQPQQKPNKWKQDQTQRSEDEGDYESTYGGTQ